MAHSCPECGQACYCGGDIDDCFFGGTDEEDNCDHCPDGYVDNDDDFYCPDDDEVAD